MGSGWFRSIRMDGERGSTNSRVSSNSSSDRPVADIADLVALLIRSQASTTINFSHTNARGVLNSDEYNEFWNDDTTETVMSAHQPHGVTAPDTSAINLNNLNLELQRQTGQLGPVYCKGRRASLSQLLQRREFGGLSGRQSLVASDRRAIGCHYLPAYVNLNLQFSNKVFCGTYSQDGNSFLSACQDRRIRVFDTRYDQFREIRCIHALDVGWSILDLAVSPDGNYVVYSSWSDYLHIANVFGENKVHQPLPLSPEAIHNFCMFSVVFSQDNRELLGGGNDGCLYVYDRCRNERTLRIEAHEDDVNAVTFSDDTSNILYSGSDDGLCKIWDRRTLRESNPCPVAVMAGHMDGITYIDSKGDSRYFISNSKDQTVKLWDVRLPSSQEVQEVARREVSKQNWDYRWQQVPRKVIRSFAKIPGDSSLMTYRGHCVLNTLLRSRFSPLFNTGQRYIYTGCATGAVVVYEVLTGKIVTKLHNHQACVRDVSWHPFESSLVSSSWDCSITKWTSCTQDTDRTEEINTSKPVSYGCPYRRPKTRRNPVVRH